MLLVEGVQIFQGVETLQAMELEPLNEGQSSLIQNNVREITAMELEPLNEGQSSLIQNNVREITGQTL